MASRNQVIIDLLQSKLNKIKLYINTVMLCYYIGIFIYIQKTITTRAPRLTDSAQKHPFSFGVGNEFPTTYLRTTVSSPQSKTIHYVETEKRKFSTSNGSYSAGSPNHPINRVDDGSERGTIILKPS